MVIRSPPGTPGMYLEIGSSSASLPSCTSCRMTVDVMVLVLLPIRKWSPACIGSSVPQVRVPNVPVHSPWSLDEMSTTAPGITFSFIVCSTDAETLATYAGSAPGEEPAEPAPDPEVDATAGAPADGDAVLD